MKQTLLKLYISTRLWICSAGLLLMAYPILAGWCTIEIIFCLWLMIEFVLICWLAEITERATTRQEKALADFFERLFQESAFADEEV